MALIYQGAVNISHKVLFQDSLDIFLYLLHSEVEGEPNHRTCHHRCAVHPAGVRSLRLCANFCLPEG